MTFPRFLSVDATGSDDRLGQLLEVVSQDATLLIIETWAGRRLYVPKVAAPDQKLAQVVGFDVAKALSDQFGGLWINVPLARSWRIQIYAARGRRIPDISTALGVTTSAVSRVLAKARSAGAVPLPAIHATAHASAGAA